MARKTRYAPPEFAHHVVNRGNDRQKIFRKRCDYMTFLELVVAGVRRFPVMVYSLCLMPNHFHAMIQPDTDNALSAYMEWVTGQYACAFRQRTETVGHGHVFQRRFWSTPIRDDQAFITVMRYVEANPRRADLVEWAEDWEWNSLAHRAEGWLWLSAPPVVLPPAWESFVNTPMPSEVLSRIRRATVPQRGRPAGSRVDL